jgi:hypothetical protein
VRPRYFRASVITTAAVAALPALFFAWGLWSFMSPDWDTDDSGAAQGFAFLTVSSLVAVTTSAIVFPAVAAMLRRRGRLSVMRLTLWSVVGVAMLSAAAAVALSVPLGFWSGSPQVGLLAVFFAFFLVVASVLALPFAALWLKMANVA